MDSGILKSGIGGGATGEKGPLQPRQRYRNKRLPTNDEQFQDAVNLVVEGKASILKASKLSGIPKSTLYLRMKEMGITSSVKPNSQPLGQWSI
jgi:hypothetical protein